MIQNTTNTQLLNDINQMKLTVAQMKHMLLEQLQVGHEIEGQLITKDGQLLLETKAGIKLPVSICEGNGELGQLLRYLVQAKDEKGLVLQTLSAALAQIEEPDQTELYTHKHNMAQAAIEKLQLPKEEQMEQCIKHLMDKQLPLDRQMITKTFYIHKQVQLPLPVVINLLEKQGEIKEPLLRLLGEVRQEGKSQLLGEISRFIEQQPLEKTDLVRIAKALSLENTVEIPLDSEMRVGGTAQYSKIMPPFEKMTVLQMKEAVIDLFEERLKVYDHKLKELSVEKRGEVLKQLPELEKVLQILEESTLPPESKNQLAPIKQSVEHLQQLQQQGEMFHVPFVCHGQTKDAEIYLFKPKKSKSQNKKDMYIVVALDMPMLNHLEIHLHHIEKQLMIQIQVENEKVQKHLQKYMGSLVGQLKSLGYDVPQSSCMIKQDEKKALVKQQSEVKQSLKGFDYKI